MTEIIFAAMVEELEKIAVEAASEASQATTSDVEQEEVSPAARSIFNSTQKTRISQPKDEKGNPAPMAHGSPVVSSEEAYQQAINQGKQQGYRAAAQKGVQEAAKVGKRAYEKGYSAAAQKGVETASRLYVKGRSDGSMA